MAIVASWSGRGLSDGLVIGAGIAGTGDTAFDTATSGAFAVDTTGLHSPRIQADQQAATEAQLIWDDGTLGTLAGHAVRLYAELSAWPSGNARILAAHDSANALQWWLDVTAAGILRLRNAGGSALDVSAAGLPVDTELRFEAVADGAGAVIVNVYEGDGVTPWDTLSGTGLGTTVEQVRVLNPNTTPTWPTIYLDEIAVADTAAEIGPAAEPATPARFPLDDRYELLLSGTWTDITGYVYDRDDVTITRGRSAEAQEADPAQMTLTLDNRDGRFSPRNPTSPYYGILGRNTQVRASLPGPSYLVLPEVGTGYAEAPDTAGLSITGDLDVRIHADLVNWSIASDLIGKAAQTGSQLSWGLYLTDDTQPSLYWSTDGAGFVNATATATAELPAASGGPLAVRATLDVDNGDGGWTVQFWMSDALDGTWVQVGDDVTGSGVTSIFDGTAPLQVGRITGFSEAGQTGRVFAAQVRDGIDGTIVASPDFTAQDAGGASFADGQGNTWTINSPAALDDRDYRFYGEVAEWPATWRMGGHDAYVKLTAAGVRRRLTQNAPPLRSVLYRNIAAIDSLISYWSFEDGERAFVIASSDPATPPMEIAGAPEMGSYSGFTSSDPLPVCASGRFIGTVRPYTAGGELIARMFVYVQEPVTAETSLLRIETTGTASTWELTLLDDGDLRTVVKDRDGVELVNSRINFFLNSLGFVVVDVELVQNGADVDGVTRVVDFNNWDTIRDSFSFVFDSYTATGKTFGAAKRVTVGADRGLTNVVVGHLLLASDIEAVIDTTVSPADDYVFFGLVARNGENPGGRMARLCFEEGIAFSQVTRGQTGNPVTLGDQGNLPLVESLEDAARSDGGILYEPRHHLGFTYRSRLSMHNQDAAVTLDYSGRQVAGDLVPVDDDRSTVNDLTARRDTGSSLRREQTTGPLSTQDPPDGVGRYPGEVTLSLEHDNQLFDQATWRLHLGTVDEARYPTLTVNLRATGVTDELAAQILALDVGDRIVLTGIPDGLPPDDVSLLVQGYSESLRKMGHEITFNLTPESPWHVGQIETSGYDRLDTAGSVLADAATPTATDLMVSTTDGPYWGDGDAPYDIFVAGERCTVSAVADGVADTFDRTEANGWGSAPDGQAWTVHGDASWASVGSGVATMALASRPAAIAMGLAQDAQGGIDVEVTLRTTVTVTGDVVFYQLLAFYDQTAETAYVLRVGFDADGIMRIGLETGRFTVEQLSPSVAVGPHTANTWYRARLRIQGGLLQGKVWTDGTSEPSGWQLHAFDDRYTSGGVGMQVFVSGGNTNTLPFNAQLGELILHNPQKLTVVRSVNGVVKAQDAGAAVTIAEPVFVAL